MSDNGLPIEVGLEKAKREILQAINQIGNSYDLPSSLVLMLVEQIVNDTKLNTYETIITNYDISIPKGVIQSTKSNVRKNPNSEKKPLVNDDVEMISDSVKSEE